MIAADRCRFCGAHGQALRSAFIRHGILSLEESVGKCVNRGLVLLLGGEFESGEV